MKKLFSIVALILLLACAQQQIIEEPVEAVIEQQAEEPTTEEMTTIETEIAEPAAEPEKTIMQELLEKAPKSYWFTTGKYGIIASGTKRASPPYLPYKGEFYRSLYWDAKTKKVYISAPREILISAWYDGEQLTELLSRGHKERDYLPAFFELQMTGDQEADKQKIPTFFNEYWIDTKADNIYKIAEPVYTKAPTEIMQEYEHQEPLEINTEGLTIPGTSTTTNLAVLYKKGNNMLAFWMDGKTNLPIAIDEIDENGEILKRTEYLIDSIYKLDNQRLAVDDKLASLPEPHIIITEKDFAKWQKYWDKFH